MKNKTTPQFWLSLLFIAGFLGILYVVFMGDIDLEGTMKDAAVMLLGILSAGITQIMNFWFGSSSGSKEKTDLIGSGLQKPADPVNVQLEAGEQEE